MVMVRDSWLLWQRYWYSSSPHPRLITSNLRLTRSFAASMEISNVLSVASVKLQRKRGLRYGCKVMLCVLNSLADQILTA